MKTNKQYLPKLPATMYVIQNIENGCWDEVYHDKQTAKKDLDTFGTPEDFKIVMVTVKKY